MSERVAELALARGGRLLGRSAARDIAELAHLETQRWASVNERLRGPTAMAGRNLSDLAANTDPGITDPLQAGVIGSGDFLVSAGAVTGGTGAFSATVAGGISWVPDANGLLRRVVRGAGGAVNFGIPPGLPVSGSSRNYTLLVDTAGNFSIVAAAAAAAGNNVVAGGSFLPGNGFIGLANVVIYNNAGVYQLGGANVNWTQGTNWIDRRPWARGAFAVRPLTSGTVLMATAGMGQISAGLNVRLECSGAPIRAKLSAYGSTTGANAGYSLGLLVDGNNIDGMAELSNQEQPAGQNMYGGYDYTSTGVAAGSHLFIPVGKENNPSTYNLLAGNTPGNPPMLLTIEELIRQSANNGTS